MRRRIIPPALAFVLGLILVPLLIMLRGIKATSPPSFETRIIWEAKHHMLVGGKEQRNPLAVSSTTLADGKEAFSHYCVACHGMDGQNTGVPFAEKLSPPAPSLASLDVQSYTDGQLKWVIDNGIWPSGMPGSRGTLSDEEIWSIVVYLRNLPPAGGQGDPEMYSH
ncbi:MAG: c-type cytochrome [Terracidiphilus sp.]